MRFPRAGTLAAVVLLSVGVVACGKSSTSASSSTSTAPAAAGGATTTTGAAVKAGAITIHNFMFQPNPTTAKVGDTITVTNQDGTDHSLTATDGSFNTGVFSSGSKTITLTKAGTFTYHCMIHNFMTGTITVTQ
jgi:plastocyanin